MYCLLAPASSYPGSSKGGAGTRSPEPTGSELALADSVRLGACWWAGLLVLGFQNFWVQSNSIDCVVMPAGASISPARTLAKNPQDSFRLSSELSNTSHNSC